MNRLASSHKRAPFVCDLLNGRPDQKIIGCFLPACWARPPPKFHSKIQISIVLGPSYLLRIRVTSNVTLFLGTIRRASKQAGSSAREALRNNSDMRV